MKTARHFFSELPQWLNRVKDPRDPESLHYSFRHLFWCVEAMFLLHLKSRNQFRWERYGTAFAENLRVLAASDEDTVAHPDTAAVVLERLESDQTALLLAEFARRLIRMKALDESRVRGHFLVAVDGTGHLSFDYPHCPHCLRTQHASGAVTYRHPVLAAFLVGASGMALAVAVEFVENPAEGFDKQDCETKAFARLAQRLKTLFPQTPFCLLLDALYASAPVMEICERNQWKYCITFKESDMPALWKEALALRQMSPRQDHTLRHTHPSQPSLNRSLRLRWVNDLDHQGHRCNALWQDETVGELTHTFAHLTNWDLNAENVESSACASRQRWRIENEGFNVLKNGGFDLEHAYSRNFNAAKNYFNLMLIAHLLQQLMVRGSLFVHFAKELGTWRNFARRLAEALRLTPIPLDTLTPAQIRFCTD